MAAAVVLLVTAGCGDDDGGNGATDDPTATTTTSAYVDTVNGMCEALIDEVIPITGDAAEPTRKEYLANRPQLLEIHEAFDARIADVPVETDADEEAAAAFDAFREMGDTQDAERAAEAATQNEKQFRAASGVYEQEFVNAPERAALSAVGIHCPAR